MENGSLTLLATTTENPSFAVTRQLLSRLTVLRMRPLGQDELLTLAKRGAEEMKADISGEVLKMLAELSRGDARALLNLVEYVAGLPCRDDPESVKEMLPDILRSQEANGGSHYDLTSALIKSIRGSDPDAALYYLACLLENGEDPRFICLPRAHSLGFRGHRARGSRGPDHGCLLPESRGLRGHARSLHASR